MAAVMKEKEVNERNRQIVLIREYFGQRREVYEARLAKFLKIYPYKGDGNRAALRRFEVAVRRADLLRKMQSYRRFRRRRIIGTPHMLLIPAIAVPMHILFQY